MSPNRDEHAMSVLVAELSHLYEEKSKNSERLNQKDREIAKLALANLCATALNATIRLRWTALC